MEGQIVKFLQAFFNKGPEINPELLAIVVALKIIIQLYLLFL